MMMTVVLMITIMALLIFSFTYLFYVSNHEAMTFMFFFHIIAFFPGGQDVYFVFICCALASHTAMPWAVPCVYKIVVQDFTDILFAIAI